MKGRCAVIDTLQLAHVLQEKVETGTVFPDYPLKKHTYTRTGGAADIFVKPAHIDDLQTILAFAKEHDCPITMLGNGSNVLVSDNGLRGIVLTLERFNSIHVDSSTITAGSGAKIIDVSRKALDAHLTGLEFACGIPGSVGGALVMNAGAYGGETSEVLAKAIVLTEDSEILTLGPDDFEFGYRKSVFIRENYIILEAVFELKPGNVDEIKEAMDTFTALRESKQPLEFPSCGSVFKRPAGHFAGKLIQDSGLQGTRIGGAEISTKHAGFIVNVDNATSSDYLALIKHAQKIVFEKFGVQLETEVKIIGE